jgi:hypothetical protein
VGRRTDIGSGVRERLDGDTETGPDGRGGGPLRGWGPRDPARHDGRFAQGARLSLDVPGLIDLGIGHQAIQRRHVVALGDEVRIVE